MEVQLKYPIPDTGQALKEAHVGVSYSPAGIETRSGRPTVERLDDLTRRTVKFGTIQHTGRLMEKERPSEGTACEGVVSTKEIALCVLDRNLDACPVRIGIEGLHRSEMRQSDTCRPTCPRG